MINISKVDEVYIRIDTDDGIARNLYDYFTFEVPGAKFMPAVRKKIWDGKIKLYNLKNHTIYLGLLIPLLKWARTHEIQVSLDAELMDHHDISLVDVTAFAKEINPTSQGQAI